MSHYTRGRAAEHRIRRILEDAGYETLRSAGSKGKVDVVAWNGQTVRFIQAKYGKDSAGPAEREALKLLPRPANASVELWRLRPRQAPEILIL